MRNGYSEEHLQAIGELMLTTLAKPACEKLTHVKYNSYWWSVLRNDEPRQQLLGRAFIDRAWVEKWIPYDCIELIG